MFAGACEQSPHAHTWQHRAGACYGLEVSGSKGLALVLRPKVEELGGLATADADVGAMFRHLGIDG